MRDFGFGTRQVKYEEDMMEEVSLLIDMLKDGPINDKEKVLSKKKLTKFLVDLLMIFIFFSDILKEGLRAFSGHLVPIFCKQYMGYNVRRQIRSCRTP